MSAHTHAKEYTHTLMTFALILSLSTQLEAPLLNPCIFIMLHAGPKLSGEPRVTPAVMGVGKLGSMLAL